mmetsp:Transcript_116483/g.336463  ORF Transcript_116483/g.336463 Transcript_116483/m.336463 type:complete len:242 (-) Transcript_116483:534-1259(-)
MVCSMTRTRAWMARIPRTVATMSLLSAPPLLNFMSPDTSSAMSMDPLPSASKTSNKSVRSGIWTSRSSSRACTRESFIASWNICLVILLSISQSFPVGRNRHKASSSGEEVAESYTEKGFTLPQRRTRSKKRFSSTNRCPVNFSMSSRNFCAMRIRSRTTVSCFFCLAASITFSTNSAVIRLKMPNTTNRKLNMYGNMKPTPYNSKSLPAIGVPSGKSPSCIIILKTMNMDQDRSEKSTVP